MAFTFSGLNFFGDVGVQPVFGGGGSAATYSLYSWGSNDSYQLGLGNQTNYSSPKQIGASTTWADVSGNAKFNLAIKTDGTLWSWGYETYGSLGLGDSILRSSPVQVGALTNWSKVATGANHASAIKTDGTLWSWGYNSIGMLGLSNTTTYSSPKQVGSLTNWSKIAKSNYHGVAIKTDGSVWSWGFGFSGSLGHGNTTSYSSPKQVGALTDWLSVSCGLYHTVATKTDGTLWGWGYNNLGQLGVGNTTSYSSPVQIGNLSTWSIVVPGSTGTYHHLAIKTDGTLWTWGLNDSGQLGLGNTTSYSSPKQVGSSSNWSTNGVANRYHSAMIKTDGTVWIWGKNNLGQLGDGTTVNKSSPIQVGSSSNWSKIGAGEDFTVAIGA